MGKLLGYISLVVVIFIMPSCQKDKPGAITAPAEKGVYIINQGNYGFGNAEISFYNPSSKQITNNLFKGVNNYSLGDVVQSMYIKDSLGFIVVNNSQKIEEVKIPSFEHIRTITIPNSSPRCFLPINDSIAYVSELYASGIHVINYRTGNFVKDISGVAAWTEQMVLIGSNVIVQEQNLSDTVSAGSVSVINTATNTFTQRYMYSGGNINAIAKDNQGRIWLASDQDSAYSIPASLYCINSDMSLNKRLQFSTGHHPSYLCIDGAGSQLYFFDKDIYSISISSTSVPSAAFSLGNGRNIYALGVDPSNGDVYAADALDFVQSSNIYRYDKSGSLTQSFTAGIITGNFTFNE